jgi:hypothetical protein
MCQRAHSVVWLKECMIKMGGGIPDLTIFLTAVRLKSWNNLLPIFAFLQAVFHDLSKRFALPVPLSFKNT